MRYTVVFVAVGLPGVPGVVRIRRLLKFALRVLGLRCVEVKWEESAER